MMDESIYKANLKDFVSKEKAIFSSLPIKESWDSIQWNIKEWLFHRGTEHTLSFNEYKVRVKNIDSKMSYDFGDFTKAIAIYLQRTKLIGSMAIRNYVSICRRLYSLLKKRNECSPWQLTRWHFDEIHQELKAEKYKLLYDAGTRLKVISDVIDKFKLSPLPINFVNVAENYHLYFNYKALSEISDDGDRLGEDKLPSYEAMAAYAQCSNNPINENEEILLRTIDLLIAMGQRANEVAFIPFDCLVEEPKKDDNGKAIQDKHGNPIKNVGIRYFAEKKFISRVHWLADQDILFALRAINRLKELTQDAREIAQFQEKHKRLWKYDSSDLLSDRELLNYLGFVDTYNLFLYLKKNNIPVKKVHPHIKNPLKRKGKTQKQHYYQAGDIENLLYPKLENHIVLRENDKVILKTSDLLSIRFDGASRFKREANTFRILPGRIFLTDINGALGSLPGIESIFERQNLTEADGSKIVMTSHQPRHWRNTLYDLAGMSNVNQALALGRQLLDQNTAYQHPTVKEFTESHRDFLTFNSVSEKIGFLRSGIRENKILGDLTDTYHLIKKKQGVENAESFLATHANALHITPFGACSHDFSLNPCPKHLQCWNGCSNLNLTGSEHEIKNLQNLLENSEKALTQMKMEAEGEFGSDVWINSLENKIENLKKGLELSQLGKEQRLFESGKDLSGTKTKTSSV
ncbi:MAG: hypothetical protein KF862_05140 [Chitinophagaceae bacterium]|nr:hypothetical protein [Chitinophagaceae bacterium]